MCSKKKYSTLQIKYVDDNSRKQTFDVYTREQDVAATIFSKNTKINLDYSIQQSEDAIHEELEYKMINILRAMD